MINTMINPYWLIKPQQNENESEKTSVITFDGSFTQWVSWYWYCRQSYFYYLKNVLLFDDLSSTIYVI